MQNLDLIILSLIVTILYVGYAVTYLFVKGNNDISPKE